MAEKAEKAKIRTPIVAVLGHVDHGKTTLLDKIRGSSVVSTEAGAITQHIGATVVPLDTIQKMSGGFASAAINVPGLLFIDTPGHHAFTTLRARGGALADLAILVVDINEGFQPQTIEALQILRSYKTPFVVAATKIDRVHGWRVHPDEPFQKTFAQQGERSRSVFENRLYEVVGRLAELGFNSDRYDRVRDFQRTIAIVPVSGVTGEGIPDLLMVLVGLAQRFLAQDLRYSAGGPGAGTVLEVKEERGLGTTLDVILYDGTISVGDEIVMASRDGIVTTRVRSLLMPSPLKEIRVEDRFNRVKSVTAAAGIKVSAPNLEGVIAGSPLRVAGKDRDGAIETVRREMEEVKIPLSEEGITIKADTIGALEALSKELQDRQIGVMKAEVGPVSRHDVVEVGTLKDPFHSVILSFNAPILPDAAVLLKEAGYAHVRVFEGGIIYRLIDDYIQWRDEKKREIEARKFEQIVLPAKITLLPHCVFRTNNPAVVGVRVLGGRLATNITLIDQKGRAVGHLKSMQLRGESIHEADAGQEVAISIEGPTVGRQINVNDILYADIPERHAKVLEHEMMSNLNPSMQDVLEEFLRLKRRADPFWGK
ncbi:MAG: translation initiation factor IF-2 [Methanomicrobiales archaeon]|nr:translation initiation factor IF-2 [Methanomicrobiales archaeon]